MARYANLTLYQMRQGIDRLQKRLAEVRAFEPGTIIRQFHNPEVDKLRASVEDGLIRTFGADTFEYRRYSDAASFSTGPIFINREAQPHEVQKALEQAKATSIALLEQAISSLEEQISEIGDANNNIDTVYSAIETKSMSQKVFVVHGHDDAAKHEVARFLEKVALEAIILHEQPNQGRTIIEKFLDCSNEVGFAVVLLTPDDLGGAKASPSQAARARQNVVFELGYFVAKLGRGKVCLLRRGDVEIPSDLYGVIYTELDAGEGWKLGLVKELKAAGLAFDANKVWS